MNITDRPLSVHIYQVLDVFLGKGLEIRWRAYRKPTWPNRTSARCLDAPFPA
ncbi:hypothetical protein LPH44_01630 [Xylella taiwanensis]|uniref:Uncharacterized protein n=1 Tax=Xylella taiwanensis TaxID=1444770 RepID=A0ABS8TX22_9GAMM|nr:hypothetical protein [Xylella taiwanensis]MCD8473102.1 hypothetical protein [Xylella taiwanensis]UFM92964.1 hypothetical protein LPH39_07315 [Xylella taiwanensis]UFN01551.1 hypothetical protein LPH43_07380 [Xylella taiwanensis]UFN06020.1 hypothetical protein LPH42_07185 [Xylella taiwanensis]UFN08311.1 hypothetical protein LPH45_07185 [Xylella taiwanensis]